MLKKLFNLKVFFIIVLITAILEGLIIFRISDPVNTFLLPPYDFYDGDDLVSANGSLISTTDLAFPVQTTNIECWKDFNYCFIVVASVMDNNFLFSDLDLREIQYWTDDFIETQPTSSAASCVEEFYRLDRRSKTVTYTRRTLNNKFELCKGIQKEPITAVLGDG